MSKAETDFKEARKSLQFSTSLLERMRQQVPQQPQASEPPIEQPQTPQNGAVEQPVEEVAQEPEAEQKTLIQGITEGVLEGVKKMFSRETPVEVKMDAIMKPAEEKNEDS